MMNMEPLSPPPEPECSQPKRRRNESGFGGYLGMCQSPYSSKDQGPPSIQNVMSPYHYPVTPGLYSPGSPVFVMSPKGGLHVTTEAEIYSESESELSEDDMEIDGTTLSLSPDPSASADSNKGSENVFYIPCDATTSSTVLSAARSSPTLQSLNEELNFDELGDGVYYDDNEDWDINQLFDNLHINPNDHIFQTEPDDETRDDETWDDIHEVLGLPPDEIPTEKTAEIPALQEQTVEAGFYWDGIQIPMKIFKDAFECKEVCLRRKPRKSQKKFGDTTEEDKLSKSLQEAAKILFIAMFSDDEIFNSSISGKKRTVHRTEKLNAIKILAITRLVGYIKFCWAEGREMENSVPTSETFREPLQSPLNQEEASSIRHKIFVQHRNQMRNYILANSETETVSRERNKQKAKPTCSMIPHLAEPIKWTEGKWIKREDWAEAFYEGYLHKEPEKVTKIALKLFELIFTQDDINNSTLSGKGKRTTQPLDEFKRTAVCAIANQMLQNQLNNPYDFQTLPQNFESGLGAKAIEDIKLKVFVSRRNQMSTSRKRKAPEPAPTAQL